MKSLSSSLLSLIHLIIIIIINTINNKQLIRCNKVACTLTSYHISDIGQHHFVAMSMAFEVT